MKYHFIAIGGAIMHNLALELLAHDYQITGSDDEIFDPAKTRLLAAGILPSKLGWFPEKIHEGLDAVILGMHAKSDNPELLKAREIGLTVYSFPEFIYKHSENKTRIVIGGSHGKTTCTAMLMHVLRKQKMDFDYLVGSKLEGFNRMVKLSDAPMIVIEGDEYLTSALDPVPKFHRYRPHLAMITGVAWDHINVFPTFENYVSQFKKFIETIFTGGQFFWYKFDKELHELAANTAVKNEPYEAPEYINTQNGSIVNIKGRKYSLQIFGKHNLENTAGVAELAQRLGIHSHEFWNDMQDFGGTANRLEKVHESEKLTVFRDFAHAPSKVRASVSAVKEQFPNSEFIAVFELHTYSSLQEDFLPAYSGTLDLADSAYVLFDPHVYELKNMPIPETSVIEKAIGNIRAFSNPMDLKEAMLEKLNVGGKKVLLLMSSGNLGGLNIADFSL
jgi:UDP-N-acetylmuramate: L-alanyl-gamma-D-glutamyl-meso-diaminopimelate ligase